MSRAVVTFCFPAEQFQGSSYPLECAEQLVRRAFAALEGCALNVRWETGARILIDVPRDVLPPLPDEFDQPKLMPWNSDDHEVMP